MLRRPDKKGFTLIELITTALIISILAAVTGGIVATLLPLFVYLPNEIKSRMVSDDIARQVIEGRPGSRGLRYASSITTAQNNVLAYVVGYPSTTDKYTVTFTYDTTADKIYVKINSGSNAAVPYYAASGITVTCPSNIFFKYYTAAGAVWTAGGSDTYNIGRVEITYTVAGSGSGSTQGSYTTTTGTNIKQYN